MKIVFASNNKHKLEEVGKIIADLAITLCTPADLGVRLEVEETGATFEENALLKARGFFDLTGLPALADDSGLEVDALQGLPGVRSARFAGEGADDEANNRLLLEKLRGVPEDKRTARFRCVLALVLKRGEEYLWEGSCEGGVAFKAQGGHGFGYDPLFVVTAYGKTLAQLGPGVKNRISHRAAALEKARRFFVNELSLKGEGNDS